MQAALLTSRVPEKSAALGTLGIVVPGRAPLNPVEGPEALADRGADAGEGPVEAGIQVGPAGLVGAVKKFVDHGDHPLRR